MTPTLPEYPHYFTDTPLGLRQPPEAPGARWSAGRQASSGPLYVFSAIGWFGFMIAVLIVLVISVMMLIRNPVRSPTGVTPGAAGPATHARGRR
jgi:hypothetical protein